MVRYKYDFSVGRAAVLGMLSSEAGLEAMHTVLIARSEQYAVIGAVPPQYWKAAFAHTNLVPRLFQELDTPLIHRARTSGQFQERQRVQHTAEHPVLQQVERRATAGMGTAESPDAMIVEVAITMAAASVLGTEDLDPRQPLVAQGLDSLSTLELRHAIQASCSVLPAFSFCLKLTHVCAVSQFTTPALGNYAGPKRHAEPAWNRALAACGRSSSSNNTWYCSRGKSAPVRQSPLCSGHHLRRLPCLG